MERACFDMGFGWDEKDNSRVSSKKTRKLDKVKTLADCEQGDIVLLDGRELRVAWFWGMNKGIAALYPAEDLFVKRDCSNLVQAPITMAVCAVRLR